MLSWNMAMLESYQLTHPELLSENNLRDVLGNCCIEITMYQDLPKSELIEIYKRIAMPLPQRKQQGSNELDELEENHPSAEKDGLSGGNNKCSTSPTSNKGPSHSRNGLQNGRLKPPVDDCSPKKIKLSDTQKKETEKNVTNKRTNDEENTDSNDSPSKKRQKITWP